MLIFVLHSILTGGNFRNLDTEEKLAYSLLYHVYITFTFKNMFYTHIAYTYTDYTSPAFMQHTHVP